MINIRAFKAPEDPEACAKFIEGHTRLLEIHFGVAKITSADAAWSRHSNTYVVVAEGEDGKIYGGARLQIKDEHLQLPIETAIGKYDPYIFEKAKNGDAEICGLWNSAEVAGMGIGSIFMARVCVVVAMQLRIETLFFLCAPVTVRIGRRIGGKIDTSLGDNGNFFYPKDDFVATAMLIEDPLVLTTADQKEKERIFSLLEDPNQEALETGPKSSILIKYKLKV